MLKYTHIDSIKGEEIFTRTQIYCQLILTQKETDTDTMWAIMHRDTNIIWVNTKTDTFITWGNSYIDTELLWIYVHTDTI